MDPESSGEQPAITDNSIERPQTPEKEVSDVLRLKVLSRLNSLLTLPQVNGASKDYIRSIKDRVMTGIDASVLPEEGSYYDSVLKQVKKDVKEFTPEKQERHADRISFRNSAEDWDWEYNFRERLSRVKVSPEVLKKIDKAEEILGKENVFGVDALLTMELLFGQGAIEFATHTDIQTGVQQLIVPDLPYTEDDLLLAMSTEDRSANIKRGRELLFLRPQYLFTNKGNLRGFGGEKLTIDNLIMKFHGHTPPYSVGFLGSYLPDMFRLDTLNDHQRHDPLKDPKEGVLFREGGLVSKIKDRFKTGGGDAVLEATTKALRDPEEGIISPWGLVTERPLVTSHPSEVTETVIQHYGQILESKPRLRTVTETLFDLMVAYYSSGRRLMTEGYGLTSTQVSAQFESATGQVEQFSEPLGVKFDGNEIKMDFIDPTSSREPLVYTTR